MRQVSVLLVLGVALAATQALSGAYSIESAARRDGDLIQEGDIAVLDRARERSGRSRELEREQRRAERLAARERQREAPERGTSDAAPQVAESPPPPTVLEPFPDSADQRAGTRDSSGGTS